MAEQRRVRRAEHRAAAVKRRANHTLTDCQRRTTELSDDRDLLLGVLARLVTVLDHSHQPVEETGRCAACTVRTAAGRPDVLDRAREYAAEIGLVG